MIERVQIHLSRVMTGYTVRAAISGEPGQPQAEGTITVLHGWIQPGDQEDSRDVLEHLSEELYNLAPHCRPTPRSLEDIGRAALHHEWAVRSA